MASLKSTTINGTLVVTDKIRIKAIEAYSSASTTTSYTTGGSGYVLRSTGSGAYWHYVSDSSSAGSLSSSSTYLVTERDVYYGLPTINGGHSYTSSTNYYIPTAQGTSGQVLSWPSSGTVPTWTTLGPSLPTGGSVGQALVKNAATDGAATWQNGVLEIQSTLTATATDTTYYLSYFLDGSTGYKALKHGSIYAYDGGTYFDVCVGNSSLQGGLTLWNNSKFTHVVAGTLTDHRTITLPDASGTVALVGHTHNYVSKSGDTMTGALNWNFGSHATARHFSNLAFYENNASSFTGTIKITLPNTTGIPVMMAMRIIVYDYNGNAGAEIFLSGYDYVDVSWHNYSASVLGTYTKGIRLAYDGTNYCVLLGTTGTSWNYSKVILADLYSGYTEQPATGYAISLITNESGYTICRTVSTHLRADAVYGAIWNDYAEYRECDDLMPGTCVQENDNGKLTIADRRLIPGTSIITDTFGFSEGETEKAKTPVAVSGRVLAYTYKPRDQYHAGMAVCSAPNGTIDIMTRDEIIQYPDAIVGIVSEIPDYETWGTGNINVNGRIWIKVR